MLAGLLLSVNENTDGREFFYVMLWNVSLKVSTFNQFRRGEKNRSSIVEEYYYFAYSVFWQSNKPLNRSVNNTDKKYEYYLNPRKFLPIL